MPDASHRKPILIVDDSLDVRMQVKQALEEAGYDVLEACDGLVGLETIDASPDLAMVICDLHMPRMGGLEFLETYQESQRLAHLPVVILTTDACPEEIGKAKRLGARGWIVKPFHPDRLVATVRWITGRPGG